LRWHKFRVLIISFSYARVLTSMILPTYKFKFQGKFKLKRFHLISKTLKSLINFILCVSTMLLVVWKETKERFTTFCQAWIWANFSSNVWVFTLNTYHYYKDLYKTSNQRKDKKLTRLNAGKIWKSIWIVTSYIAITF